MTKDIATINHTEFEMAKENFDKAPDCFKVRYDGERADMEFLVEKYRLGDFLDLADGVKSSCLSSLLQEDGKLLSPAVFPRLYRVARQTLDRLGLDGKCEVYLWPDAKQPMADWVNGETENTFLFCVTPAQSERLEDDELSFFFGRWLAHRFFGIEHLNGVEKLDEKSSEDDTILPPWGDLRYGKWLAKSKVSEDRVGALAAGSFEAAARAILKQELGFSGKDIQIPRMAELGEVEAAVEDGGPRYDSIPFRLKALRLFCEEWYSPSRSTMSVESVDRQIDEIFRQWRRRPEPGAEEASMCLLMTVGLDMAAADGAVGAENTLRCVFQLLLKFTDNPEEVLVFDVRQRRKIRTKAIDILLAHADEDGRYNVCCDLMQVALADSARLEEKTAMVAELAQKLGFAPDVVQLIVNICVDEFAALASDPLLDRMVERCRLKMEGREGPREASPVDWRSDDAVRDDPIAALRYGGDWKDERTLIDLYHVRAHIDNSLKVEAQNQLSASRRADSMRDGVRLTPAMAPRVCAIVRRAAKCVGLPFDFEVFTTNEGRVAACAGFEETPRGPVYLMQIDAFCIEQLDDDELAFVIGHEMSHLKFGNSAFGRLKKIGDEAGLSKLPLVGERLLVQWSQKIEVTADRLGAVAAGSADAAIRASVKGLYGLSSRNFNPDVDQLVNQLRNIRQSAALADGVYASHPLNPIRLKALELFCEAYFAPGFTVDKLAAVDARVDELYELVRDYPKGTDKEAAMRVVATAGLDLVESDGVLEDNEFRCMVEELFTFTDDPVAELEFDRSVRRRRFERAARILRQRYDDELKGDVMKRLVRLALEDGSISAAEIRALERIAIRIGFPAEEVGRILVSNALEAGFQYDFLLEDLVRSAKAKLLG